MKKIGLHVAVLLLLVGASARATAPEDELRVGRAGHAFDHLGAIGDQAETAAASGATVIYASGLGALGYGGLPPAGDLAEVRRAVAAYNAKARAAGVRLIIGYACATSIVKLDTFDKNWSAEFRAQFGTPPAEWRQQGRDGKPLRSWYGGYYEPACMNNSDWRCYERFIVRQQLETGHDGIFFDNPTVHPQGCYCPNCMKKFAGFLAERKLLPPNIRPAESASVDLLRRFAADHPADFLRFRCTIAADFLAEMRRFARTVRPAALVTCNNSLNSPDRLFSQCRKHGYNIEELARVEDLVVVEDQVSQPRALPGDRFVEYAPTYKQLLAVAHGKPVVAVTLAESDYHTPPDLVCLAMAEAAAGGASYLWWPTWPEGQRRRMTEAVRRQADFLRRNEGLLNDAPVRRDALLLLPFRRWVETDRCAASSMAAALSGANFQYEVVADEGLAGALGALGQGKMKPPVFIVESLSALDAAERALVQDFQRGGGRVVTAEQPDWLARARSAPQSVAVEAAPGVRAIVCDQPGRTVVHLLNLNVERLSSFEDKVHAVSDVRLTVRVPFAEVRSVTALTADDGTTAGALVFRAGREGMGTVIETAVPRLEISAILVIER